MAKIAVATKRFILPNGGMSKDVTPDCVGIAFAFTDSSNIEFRFDTVGQDNRHCAMARGYAEDLGNTYAGVKGDAAKAFEAVQNRIEQHQSGPWYADREGPSPVLLHLALCRALDKQGKTYDAAVLKEKLKDAAYRAAVSAHPDVDLEYKALVAERANENLRKAQEAAKAQSPDLGALAA